MSSLPRLLGFSLVLLLAFLAAAAGAQVWLRGQHERLQTAASEAKHRQVEAAFALVSLPENGRYDETDAERLAGIIGAEIELLDPSNEPTAPLASLSASTIAVELTTGQTALVSVPTPPTSRLLLLHQRVVVALLVFALVLIFALILALLLHPATPGEASSRPPWGFAKAEMESLQHLARTSVSQGVELARERDERVRAEQEAYLNQVRLNQALEEKIRLGRDLHDGIIQSLYATGLTLENVRDLLSARPDEAVRRLQGSIELLNAAIRDVRNYISGLKPDQAREAGLSQIVGRIAAELRAGRAVEFEIEIDDFAAGRLADESVAGAVQIVREAVSNALRHGGATRVAVRLHEGDGAIALLIQDNGSGFDAAGGSRGQGLANMRGRAESAGGSLQVDSAPGRGTRIVLTLPLVSTAS